VWPGALRGAVASSQKRPRGSVVGTKDASGEIDMAIDAKHEALLASEDARYRLARSLGARSVRLAADAGQRMRSRPLAAWWFAFALACAQNPAEQVRSVTYPPDFHYITSQEIRTTMAALAVEVVALDRELGGTDAGHPSDPTRVAAILTRMERLAASLKRREHSSHPRLDDYAPLLRRDIERALVAARSDPPSYYAAGRVSGACSSCHAPPLRPEARGHSE
jgi:hypothetical protein